MSPARSMMARSPRSRTRTSSRVVVIAVSFQVHDEPDGVERTVVGRLELVDHVLDEEEPPAAWRLRAGQLRLEVRRLRLLELAPAAAVGDLDAQALAARDHAHRHRQLGAVAVAVLHRV